ncbi:uncharacterized protein LOC143151298 isoform X3 [Ptiloglossa arizonensis]|uniref:uncharacterized protein LOC143151298 isoform X3 n=1 Tax=Ptiloglossa arizonensis TaxID=3350558 RepID=UPI003FA047E8
METGFLNFHDEEHFSDFSLSLDQNLMEKPQDLLMHMVENDFDYMETHLDIVNSDSLWSNEHEPTGDMDEISISEIPTISKIDNIKEDFAKVLTDWQEHIGYLQATDMDEYMDVIGLSMNTTDKKSFCISESVFHDEQSIQTLKSDYLKTNQKNLGKKSLQSSQNTEEPEKGAIKQNSYDKICDEDSDNKKIETVSKSLPKESKHTRKQNKIKKDVPKYESIGINITANVLMKQKKKKKNSIQHNKNIKNTNYDKNESIPNYLPALEAGTVESLLEQFEASENTVISSYTSTKINTEYEQDLHIKSTKIQQRIKQSGITTTKTSLSQISNLHKNIRNIRDALPERVIEKIKTSRNKKLISLIPSMPNAQSSGRSNGTRMQDAAATLSRNKLLKIVTNNTKSRAIDGGLVHLDHDYCSNSNSSSSSDSNSEYERQFSDSEKVTLFKNYGWQPSHSHTACVKQTFSSHLDKTVTKRKEYSTEGTTRKDDSLESSKVSDNEEKSEGTVFNGVQVNGFMKLKNEIKNCEKGVLTEQESNQNNNILSNISNCINQVHSESLNTSTQKMKIRSALATSILQLQRDVLRKTKTVKTGTQKTKQMISVLKKPLNIQLPILMTTSNESIITISNALNDKVHNIIVHDTEKTFPKEEESKPPRRKLNLAEYRSRREQNRSDNSRTNSPIQPMTLVYVHHASTTTEPIKDDPGNLIWSEREIVSVLKPKIDIDEEKVRPKAVTCNVGIQTYETVFEFPSKSLIDVDERYEEQREKRTLNTSPQSCRKNRISSSSSRSRSRSNSKSGSRSRSRSSNSRSRSRKQSNTRHRRISHRRSSVSSSSSWSSRSRSRSNTRSTFSSGSRYSRSRSRSSRSRSRCSSRYSSCSRSSSRSNFGRSKWSNRRKKEKRYRRSYDRQRRHSSGSYRSYRGWKRSPSKSYRKSYENWYDREKQRQVEERRVIYVGRLDDGITNADLRRRFEIFGSIVDISIHFREHGDNYGFVTFAYKNDAYEAVEHGNDDPTLPRYDLCFGGRRAFCKVKYADLDGMASNTSNSAHIPQANEDNTFDLLLKEAKAKLHKRKWYVGDLLILFWMDSILILSVTALRPPRWARPCVQSLLRS